MSDRGPRAPASRVAADSRASRKRLVVFSDGTGNSSAKLVKTNVWRLYEAVELGPPPAGDDVPQLAFYDDGVGSSAFRPLAILGGVFGFGLARNVKDAYAFLCRHWRPGDEIHAFGFSRGAFTIRVLTGLVATQGIITRFGDESELQRHVATAWRRFRSGFAPRPPMSFVTRAVRRLRDAALAARDFALGRDPYPGPRPLQPGEADRRGGDRPDPRANAAAGFAFVGLWDTVDAYGLPIEEMTRAWDLWIWPLSMRDRAPAANVERAVHALCLDDMRNTFHPVLWDERGQDRLAAKTGHVDTARVAQVWFAGAHANVGGGYPDDRLAHVPLVFMIDRIDRAARGIGLRLDAARVAEYRALADLDGALYDSRKGLGGFYRYQPRRFDLLSLARPQHGDAGRPFGRAAPHAERMAHGSSYNPDLPTPLIHETALRRIEHGAAGYAPITLPREYAVVAGRAGGAAEGAVVAPATITDGSGAPIDRDPAARLGFQERLWNWVWLRRVIYFVSLGIVLVIALLPFWIATEATGGDDPAFTQSLAALPDALRPLLPGMASFWIDAWAARPRLALGLLVALGLLLALGAATESAIRDRMQRWWRGDPRIRAPAPDLPALDGAVHALRTSRVYEYVLAALKTEITPAVFALIFLYVGAALVSQAMFGLRGATCAPGPSRGDWAPNETMKSAAFDPKNPCAGTGIPLQGGRRYRIDIAGDSDWADDSMPADLFGHAYDGLGAGERLRRRFLFTLALPLRRHLTAPWYVPFARIGADGRDLRALTVPVRPPARERAGRLTAGFEFTARRNGELFLYVNDAVPFLGLFDFHANNRGSAAVTVTRLSWENGAPARGD